MAATIFDIAVANETTVIGSPECSKIDMVFDSTSQGISNVLVSIDEINDTPLIDAPNPESHSQSSTKNVESNFIAESVKDSLKSIEAESNVIINASTNNSKKKYRNIFDSDSEEDENSIELVLKNSNSDKESIGTSELRAKSSGARNKRSTYLIDSDSDEDKTLVEEKTGNKSDSGGDNDNNTLGITAVTKPLKSRFRTLVDSDSDDQSDNPNSPNANDENEISIVSKKTNVDHKKHKSKISMIVDSESEYDNVSDHSSPVKKTKKWMSSRKTSAKTDTIKEKSKFSALVDTDSEDDTERGNLEQSSNEQNNGNSAKKSGKTTKKRTGSARASKDEAMRQIHSETQRLIRSSAVSLPYHVPKQRSLQDFLNRKKLIPALPIGLTTAAKVKMSSDIVGKVLKEKEKEAELFYKSSDSDSETITCTPVTQNPIEVLSPSCKPVDQIAIETQKISKNDVQNAHNKKEILQQGASDIGLPRKLFVDEIKDFAENDRTIEKETIIDVNDDTVVIDPRKKIKETKQGMQEGNAPRKLFPSDYDEGIDSLPKENDSSIIITNDDPRSESPKNVDDELNIVDEGVHSLNKMNEFSSSNDPDENDFVLKLPDSDLADSENLCEIERVAINDVSKNIVESTNISETPFISNKEYAKLNDREKSSKQRKERAETLASDDDSFEPAFGHVHGLPPPDIDDHITTAKTTSGMKKKFLSDLSSSGPKLRGTPGMMIDFSNDSGPNEKGVKSLVDRFIRHSTVTKPTETNSPITVLCTEETADGIKITEEILPYKLPINDNSTDKELEKPGAKYARLKNDLIEKMAKKRGEEWKLKEEQENNEMHEDNEDESNDETDIELVDEEFEGSTESEPELEDDMPIEKEKRKIRKFADEEAEVSGDEENDDEPMVLSEEDEAEVDEDGNISPSVNDDDDTCDNSSDVEELSVEKTKKLTRIVKMFEDDSNSLPEPCSETDNEPREKLFERTKTDVDMFATDDNNDGWLSDTETEFPPSQILPRDQADARSQLCKTPLTAINVLRFVSPITQLTALNSCTDSPATNDLVSQRGALSFANKTPLGVKESPISCDMDKRIGFQKKLFEDTAGTVNDEELMDICSGKFTGIENDDRTIDPMGQSSHGKVTETQLMGLCSGSFSSQNLDIDKFEDKKNEIIDETSQDIRLTFDDDSCDDITSKDTTHELKKLSTYRVDSSSDDENLSDSENGEKCIVKKKKCQKLYLSDDEDNDEERDELLDSDNGDKYVNYDSEENEIVTVPRSDMKKAAADFLEAEAELSESEWGSEDEDEKGLDRLEFEEADNEEIDENQMRDQLGKIHMRQVQDDDQREVRMLQELLFDDGDLHTDGSGRERQFKWKNIDKLGGDVTLGPRPNDDEDNGEPVEEENDLEWRKERLEREKFIEDKMKLSTNEITDELAVDSQVFKLGIKALKRGKTSQTSQKELEPVVTKPILPRTVLDLVGGALTGQNTKIVQKAVSRGSFLARGDECLARLAVHIKHSTETTIVTRKNPRNCVFTHISPSAVGTIEKEQRDVAIEDFTVNSKARKRKPTAGITPRSTKKAKVDGNRSTGKKLF